MVCGRFYDKFGHKNDPHISDRVRKLISIPIPTDRQNHMIPDDGRKRLRHLYLLLEIWKSFQQIFFYCATSNYNL